MRQAAARANVVLVALLTTATAVTAAILAPETRDFSTLGVAATGGVAATVFAVLGALIVSRQPRNVLGPGFCVQTLVVALTLVLELFLEYSIQVKGADLRGTATAAWVSEWIWVPLFLPILTFLFLLSPDGSLPSRRWRPVAAAIAVSFVCLVVGTMFTPFGSRPSIENPYQIDELGRLPRVLMLIGLYAVPPSIAVSAAGLIVRFRRSRGIERQQLKWFTASAVLAGLLIVAALVTAPLTNSDIVFSIALFGGMLGTASAIAVSVLRYRLYDIDVIINRALVYGSLTAATVGSYVALVVGLGWVTQTLSGQAGNEVVVAATTLIVAALFQPARRRIQGIVDRRFYRSRYDAARTVEAFQARLRDELELDALRGELSRAVQETLRPASVGVWLRSGR